MTRENPEDYDDDSIGWMCKVDYDHHLGNDYFGATVYPSEGSLRENKECVKQCGIVKVQVILLEVVQEEDFNSVEGQANEC